MVEGRAARMRSGAVGTMLTLGACITAPRSQPAAAEEPVSLNIAPQPAAAAPAPAPAPAVTALAIEIRGDAVTVAGVATSGDGESLRAVLARHRQGATVGEVLLIEPKPELVDELVRAASRTELKSLVLTTEGTSIEVLLAAPELASHEVVASSDGRLQLLSVHGRPISGGPTSWIPGKPVQEAAVRETLRNECASSCLVRLVRAGDGAKRPLWGLLAHWQALAQGLPQVKTSLVYVVQGKTAISGRLPPEAIQRIVRKSFGAFRACYERGLARDPKLEGRVNVRFVIGRDGKVTSIVDGGSDIPDAAVRDCVIDAFAQLEFPPPEDGIVIVVYPIMLAPG